MKPVLTYVNTTHENYVLEVMVHVVAE